MSYLDKPIQDQSLNGIITISDGTLEISDGTIAGLDHLDLKTLIVEEETTLNGTVSADSIVPINSALTIGDISKNLTLIGNEINIVGTASVIESAQVQYSDHSLQLNKDGGDILLENSGIEILGDNNGVKASCTLDVDGNWTMTSPDNKLTVSNIVCDNLDVANITYEDLNATNVNATNKMTSDLNYMNRQVSYASAITHLNSHIVKSNTVQTNSLSFFSSQIPFFFQYGSAIVATIAAGALGSVDVLFDKSFANDPNVLVSVNGGSGYQLCFSVVNGSSISPTGCTLQVRNTGTSTASNIRVAYMAIGI